MLGRHRRYADRQDAGRALAQELSDLAGRPDVVVLGLPRGGVPVAAEVARALGAPLDALVVRKLGVPGRPELAMGAVAGVGNDVEVVWNEQVLAAAGLDPSDREAVRRREVAELARRESTVRRGRERAPLEGRLVVLVDDGLATGATVRAAMAAVRRRRPSAIVVAVPVASSDAVASVRAAGARVVCPWVPPQFRSVGDAYIDFGQTPDHDVVRALDAAAER